MWIHSVDSWCKNDVIKHYHCPWQCMVTGSWCHGKLFSTTPKWQPTWLFQGLVSLNKKQLCWWVWGIKGWTIRKVWFSTKLGPDMWTISVLCICADHWCVTCLAGQLLHNEEGSGLIPIPMLSERSIIMPVQCYVTTAMKLYNATTIEDLLCTTY